jgi:hypothetical protein
MQRPRFCVSTLLCATIPFVAVAQGKTRGQPVSVSANIEGMAQLQPNSVMQLALSRALGPDEGELALVVDGVDVTALAERSPTRIVYRPAAMPLAEGSADIVVYRRAGGRWTELKRFTKTVISGAALTRVSFTRSATLGNKGQLAEGRSEGIPDPDRRAFQDFVLNAGFQSTHGNDRWALETQSSYVGASRQEEALRFGVRGDQAPKMDLANYLVTLRGPGTALSVGHVSFGTHRHVASGFASRGGNLVLARGGTTLTAGALNGSSEVGWDNLVGFNRPTHRVFGASLGQELLPKRPGAVRLEITMLDGAILPQTSFTQGAVIDAEESDGGGLQLIAATPNQRLRFAGGFARSRFNNPQRDPQLLGDTLFTETRAVTRGARFVELNGALLQNTRLPLAGLTSVTVGWRHERVDPLYRSVAAPTAADRDQHTADAAISLGAITTQVSQSWNRDNLDRVPSVLTTTGRTTTANVAIPLNTMGGTPKPWAPLLIVSLNRTHQLADGLPTNGAFRPQDLPDQVTVVGDASAQWQTGRWRLTLRTNRSDQDNRQELRERADFVAAAHTVGLGLTLGSKADVGVDVSQERAESKERDETTRGERLTLNASLRPLTHTQLLVAVSALRSRPAQGAASYNGDQRLELSQGINVWKDGSGTPRGQLFLRYGRTTSLVPDFTLGGVSRVGRRQWTLASGLNLRVL